MTDKLDQALAALGIDADDLDPDVLDTLRRAASKPPKQLRRDDLKTMSPKQITAAEQAGKLDHLLGRKAD